MKNCCFSKIPCHIFPNQWFDFFCQNGRCHCWIYDWDERAPIIIHPCYRTRHRNFMLEWPRCSDQCNLEMCHELYYYWCWFCDISGSVVVTVTWYLYLCFVVLFTFTSCSLHCQLFIFKCLHTLIIQCHFSLMRDLTVHYHTWLCSGAFY